VKVLGTLADVESIAADDVRITVKVRDRLSLIQWLPSPDVEAAVSTGRITIALALEPPAAAWKALLEKLLKELADAARRKPAGNAMMAESA
jgi:hypothetical protein